MIISSGLFEQQYSIGAFVIARLTADMHTAIVSRFTCSMQAMVIPDFTCMMYSVIIPGFGMGAVATGGGGVA